MDIKSYIAIIRVYDKSGKTLLVDYDSFSTNSFDKELELERTRDFIAVGVYGGDNAKLFLESAKEGGVSIQIMECKEVGLFEGKL